MSQDMLRQGFAGSENLENGDYSIANFPFCKTLSTIIFIFQMSKLLTSPMNKFDNYKCGQRGGVV
jgi:hypothetical protein